jgi:PKD repeat protein
MQKTKHLFFKIGLIVFVFLAVVQSDLHAWDPAIQIAEKDGVEHRLPVARYSPQGKLFVVYQAGPQIHLSSYDGTSVAFEKVISESSMKAYESSIAINKLGFIHIVWVEASSYEADVHYLKYRFHNGTTWSPVSTLTVLKTPGTVPGGFVTRKIENMHIVADENNNIFVVFMIWPSANCQFVCKYGTTVRQEAWPMSGRSKHPGVAVDSDFVHVAWQQLWGREYTIAYCKRANSLNGKWERVIDVKDGIHRPSIAVDPNRVPHVFFMEANGEVGRNSVYKYWTGSGFSPKFIISDDAPRSYSNIDLSVYDFNNIFTMELTNGGSQIYYNWKQNGEWSGHKLVGNTKSKPDYTSATLSPDGSTAVVAYVNNENSIYINLSTGGSTPPPPPNIVPVASFKYSPIKGHFPLKVYFNAAGSHDNDGTIVSFRWDFGDGVFAWGIAPNHTYTRQGTFLVKLTVTDNGGLAASTSHEVEIYPPNVAPVAMITYSPSKGHFPLNVIFNANDSHDSDGQIVKYSWDFGDGVFGQGLAVTHRYSINGFRKITLTITDDDGATAKKSVMVEVFPPNQPPVVVFTLTPTSGLYPLSVIFDAENSRDSDGTIVSYSWDFGDGTFGKGKRIGHLYANKGVYPVSLTLIDDDGAKASQKGQVDVFGLFPPLNVQYRRETNRNLFYLEYLYHITWSANPSNVAVGARIAAYNIYRKAKGAADYTLFIAIPVSNKDTYEHLDRTLGSAPLEYDYRVRALDSAGRESD